MRRSQDICTSRDGLVRRADVLAPPHTSLGVAQAASRPIRALRESSYRSPVRIFCTLRRNSGDQFLQYWNGVTSRIGRNSTGTSRALRSRMQKHETRDELNLITSQIIGDSIALHHRFGPGLLETVYLTCLARDLIEAGLDVVTDCPIGLNYKDVHIACAFRVDMVVNGCVLVELKARRTGRARSPQTAHHLSETCGLSSWVAVEFWRCGTQGWHLSAGEQIP